MESETELKVIDKRMQESTPAPVSADNSPASMLMMAMEKGLDLEKLEKVMDLQARWEAQEARKSYHEAMAAFKENPPKIEKDRHVSYSTSKGRTEYNHASLANVTEKVSAALSKCGLSASWVTDQQDKLITVTCTITHRQGHSESTSLSAAPDDSGGKNSIQAIGSTISYLERYTLLALTGLATADMDDDGKGADPPELITEAQVKEIEAKVKEKRINRQKVLDYFKLDSFSQVPAKNFKAVMDTLKTAKGEPVKCPDKDGKEVRAADCKKCDHRQGCPEWEAWDGNS